MRVLCVDDSRATRNIIRCAVDLLNFEFLEASNGREAMELLEQEKEGIDLVLLDWNMPEMDGITLLKILKADPRFQKIPVTMVTTEVERHKVIEAIGAGAHNYVMKPFTQENLIEKIMDSLGMQV
jgi:two-component system chemotaxis response regulator CheY